MITDVFFRRNKADKPHWSDSEDRYGDNDWQGYDESREGPPQQQQQQQQRQPPTNMRGAGAAGPYPPPPPPPGNMKTAPPYSTGQPPAGPPMMHGRGGDNRYGPPPPPPMPPMGMQQRFPPYGGYMSPYDQRHMGPPPQHMVSDFHLLELGYGHVQMGITFCKVYVGGAQVMVFRSETTKIC